MVGHRMRVGIVAYEGCFAAEIFGLADLLLIANRVAQQTGVATDDLFEVSVLGRSAGTTIAAGGFPLGTTCWHHDVDVLVVPGFEMVPTDDVAAKLADWVPETAFIAAANDSAVPVASVCVGAFLLGEAGLLDGRGATTSWLFARRLADRHPRCTVTPEAIMVGDALVTTTAGFSAVHDLAMRLIRDHAGDDVARRAARVTLVADNRTSQEPYIDAMLVAASAPEFAFAVQRHLVERISEPYDLSALARAFNVSTRTMLRRFAAECGQSPLDYLQAARVDAAKRLLESTSSSVADVMERVGYRDVGTFRRLFAEHVGATPAAYRRQFRQVRPRGLPVDG